jgi:hypothetical protein
MTKYEHHKFSPKGLKDEINVVEITSDEEMFMAEKTTSKKQLDAILEGQEDILATTEQNDDRFRLSVMPIDNAQPFIKRTENPMLGNNLSD